MIGVDLAAAWRHERHLSLATRPFGLRSGPASAVLCVAAVTETGVRAAVVGLTPLTTLALCLLALCGVVPLVALEPVAAAATLTAVGVVSLAAFRALPVADGAAELIALYLLGGRGAEGRRIRLLASALPATFLLLALADGRPLDSDAGTVTVVLAALTPAAAWAGIADRARREAEANAAAREVIASTLLEHTARGERARIARELHDVVAHHVSMIAVQAETARLATPGLSAAGAQRLAAIGDTARAGLTEMRRLLGVLRADTGGPAELQPQPGLTQLPELLDEAREASAAGARLILRGTPVPLDPGVELAAYRIVQEALTNVRRHADGAAVDVEVHYAGDALRVRIRDNGPGPPTSAHPGGNGLAGMRERAAAVGGRVSTGPAPGGGFLVDSVLPIGAGRA